MSSNPTKLGCGTGSWECYNPGGSKGCYPCPELTIFGLCKSTAAETCGRYNLRPTRFDTRHSPAAMSSNPTKLGCGGSSDCRLPGEPCTSNSECNPKGGVGWCGRMGNSDSPLVCCTGGNTTVLAKDYCVGNYSPSGTPCRADAQCQSDNCSGNWDGLADGTCS